MTALSLSVIILAGGLSQRMGHDKALLPMPDGRPLLCHTVQIALGLTPHVVLVTPWSERYRAVLAPWVTPASSRQSNIQFVQESLSSSKQGPPTQGPLSGFVQGWTQVSSDWCLLLACDLPCLQQAVLQQWWCEIVSSVEKSVGILGGAIAPSFPVASLVPRDSKQRLAGHKNDHSLSAESCRQRKRWEPLCGFYHRRCLPSLNRYCADGGRSFQGWLTNISVMPYHKVPKSMLWNCNTPEDWARVQRLL